MAVVGGHAAAVPDALRPYGQRGDRPQAATIPGIVEVEPLQGAPADLQFQDAGPEPGYPAQGLGTVPPSLRQGDVQGRKDVEAVGMVAGLDQEAGDDRNPADCGDLEGAAGEGYVRTQEFDQEVRLPGVHTIAEHAHRLAATERGEDAQAGLGPVAGVDDADTAGREAGVEEGLDRGVVVGDHHQVDPAAGEGAYEVARKLPIAEVGGEQDAAGARIHRRMQGLPAAGIEVEAFGMEPDQLPIAEHAAEGDIAAVGEDEMAPPAQPWTQAAPERPGAVLAFTAAEQEASGDEDAAHAGAGHADPAQEPGAGQEQPRATFRTAVPGTVAINRHIDVFSVIARTRRAQAGSMQVLIVATNRERLPDPVLPLGAALIAAAARDQGHAVHLWDAGRDGTWAELAAVATALEPMVIGVSLRNVDDTAWPQARSCLDDQQAAVATLRQACPRALIVLGGSAFSLFPEAYLARLGGDVGVVGEGEAAFASILAEVVAGGRPSGIRRGRVAARWLRPAYDLVDAVGYLRESGSINIQTKRGCDQGCAYCTYPGLEGRLGRCRPPAEVVADVEHLVAVHGAGHLFVVDNVFNHPRDAALACCAALAQGSRVPWSAFVTPAGFDQAMADAMVRAGCVGVDIGADAVDATTLAGLGKPFAPEAVPACITACKRAGLKVGVSLILGGPGETLASLERGREILARAQVDAIFALLGVRVFPHTPLHRRLRAQGWDVPVGLEPVFYLEEAVRDDLLAWARIQAAVDRRWHFPGLRDPSHGVAQRWVRSQGGLGPLWHFTSPARRR